MPHRIVNTLDGHGNPGLKFECGADEGFDGLGDRDGAGIGETAYSSREIGRQPVHVVLGGVEVHNAAMDAHAHIDVEPESTTNPAAEGSHLTRDIQSGLDRAPHIVLVRVRMAEEGQQPVTFGGADVSFVAPDDPDHVIAVTTHHRAVHLWLDPRRQGGRVHQIGEHDGEPANLALTDGRGEEIFGFWVAVIERQHLFRQFVRRVAVTRFNRLKRQIEELVDATRLFRFGHRAIVTDFSAPAMLMVPR